MIVKCDADNHIIMFYYMILQHLYDDMKGESVLKENQLELLLVP